MKLISKAMILAMVSVLAIGVTGCSAGKTGTAETAAPETTVAEAAVAETEAAETAQEEVDETAETVFEYVTQDELNDCFEEIYNVKVGTDGSEERVAAAAQTMNDFIIANNEEIYSLEWAVELTNTALDTLTTTHTEDSFNEEFQKSFDAVLENIQANNSSLAETESFKCIVRAVELHMEHVA